MKKDLTEIVIILDSSGSMGVASKDTIGGINTFIEDQKKLPGEVTFTLATFSDSLVYKYYRVKLDSITSFSDYYPMGNTALIDSSCDVIDNIGKALAITPENERPEKVIVAIMTDGEENSSHRFSINDLASRIKTQTEQYKWEFLFLGANIDAFSTGQSYQVKANNTFGYASTSDIATLGLRNMSSAVSYYRTTDNTN